jgi:hypothetical protein
MRDEFCEVVNFRELGEEHKQQLGAKNLLPYLVGEGYHLVA